MCMVVGTKCLYTERQYRQSGSDLVRSMVAAASENQMPNAVGEIVVDLSIDRSIQEWL